MFNVNEKNLKSFIFNQQDLPRINSKPEKLFLINDMENLTKINEESKNKAESKRMLQLKQKLLKEVIEGQEPIV